MAQSRGPLLCLPYLLRAWLKPRAKSCLQPHSKPRALGTRQSHHTGQALKPAPAPPSAPASGARQAAWSQAPEQKEVKPRCGAPRPRLLSVQVQVQSERPGPGLTRHFQAPDPPVGAVTPAGGLLPATGLCWVTPAGRGARVPWIRGLRLLEAPRGPGCSSEAARGPL